MGPKAAIIMAATLATWGPINAAASWISGVESDGARSADALEVWAIPAVADGAVIDAFRAECSDCTACNEAEEPQRHETLEEGPYERVTTEHPTFHNCTGVNSLGPCSVDHVVTVACNIHLTSDDGTPVMAHDILNQVVAANAEQVVELIDRYPEVLKLNSTRSAIQARGCNGEIIAHLPLTRAAAAVLNAAIAG